MDRSFTLTAVFEQLVYEVQATASTEAGGTVTGGGAFTHGQVATLTAEPAEGYQFDGWYENGEQVVQSWMVGYCPAEKPRYVVVVLVENSIVSGERSAPVFRELCEELYFYAMQKEKR